MRKILPVAGAQQVRGYALRLGRRHPGALAGALALHAVAAVAGLVTPRLLGGLVERVRHGAGSATVDHVALAIAGFLLVQAALVTLAYYASAQLGERVLAELREEFVDRVLALPLSVVEQAGAGDLLTRASRDISMLSYSIRFAVPETLIALLSMALAIGALALSSPLLALPCVVGVPVLVAGTRWYLRRAGAGYLRANAAYADITDGLSETVDGARTVEALRLERARQARTDEDISGSYRAERYTLFLRTIWWPTLAVGYVLPVSVCVFAGGWCYQRGWVTLSQVTAATLYTQQLIDPIDRVLSWLDELQLGGASLARVIGVAGVAPDRVVAPGRPDGERLAARDVRYSYVAGREVLRGVSLELAPGERLAVVGPSGAGKSTLGRLLAGVYPPDSGSVTVGGTPLTGLPLAELRTRVALVTQEFHIFVGTVRDNVALARADPAAPPGGAPRPGADAPPVVVASPGAAPRPVVAAPPGGRCAEQPGSADSDARVCAALAAVDALDWVRELPDGLDTLVGTGNHPLSAAQAQQLALARLILADPHTLVLDEATSLLDPRAARHLERSLAAVLRGRTVVAIAHRLFSAHDADRVAVVEDGLIVELGSHHELIAAGGSYAALWRSWHGEHPGGG